MKKIISLSFLLLPVFSCLAQNFTKVNVCVIENGQLKNIEADYNSQNREQSILVGGVRKKINEVYPLQGKDYAAGQPWFINNEKVLFTGKPFVKYGLPRVLGMMEIEKNGMYNDVGVYVEAGTKGFADIIYIPVRQGCEFQPYQLDCGRVDIESIDNPSSASMDFTAKITGETDKINYSWESQGIQLSKGQGSNSISVDTRNKKEGDRFSLSLYASTVKKCWVAIDRFAVKKMSQPAANKWGQAERDAFMKDCVPGTKMGQQKGTAYCSCMLEKIIKIYPDPAMNMKKENIENLAAVCLNSLKQ